MKLKILICIISLFISSAAIALANPAATNCTNKGYKYLLVNNIGICLFPDNSYCEEWAFFRGTCKPGQNKATSKNDQQENQINDVNE